MSVQSGVQSRSSDVNPEALLFAGSDAEEACEMDLSLPTGCTTQFHAFQLFSERRFVKASPNFPERGSCKVEFRRRLLVLKKQDLYHASQASSQASASSHVSQALA